MELRHPPLEPHIRGGRRDPVAAAVRRRRRARGEDRRAGAESAGVDGWERRAWRRVSPREPATLERASRDDRARAVWFDEHSDIRLPATLRRCVQSAAPVRETSRSSATERGGGSEPPGR